MDLVEISGGTYETMAMMRRAQSDEEATHGAANGNIVHKYTHANTWDVFLEF